MLNRASIAKFAKRLLPMAVLGIFAIGGALTATADAGPQFNNLPNDYPTLQTRPSTGGNFSAAVNTNPGQSIDLLVWAHNTVVNTSAYNTKVKVTVPTSTGTSFTPSAQVSADNATAVTGTVAVNTTQEANLNYIAGSARLMKNVGGVMTFVDWPSNVNPDDVVSANGVSLGHLDGCWQYAQAVFLRVQVNGTTPAINTNKKVGRAGGAPFSEAIEAQPGDLAEYQIFLQNTGNGTGIKPMITDTLDARHTYVPGSSVKRIKVNNNDVDVPIPDSQIVITNLPNGEQKLTYTFPDMAPQPSASVYLYFQVRLKDKNAFAIGENHIKNQATSSFQNAGSVNTNQTDIKVVRNPDPVVSFDLVKKAANVSNGDTVWKDQIASAAPGDTIAFKLTMTNTGNTPATQVTLKDILPAGMTYVADSGKLYTNENQNGVSIPGNAIVNNGYVFDVVNNGTINQKTFIFWAKLTDDCAGVQSLVNKGQVIWQSQVRAEDIATVIVACQRGLLIQKTVRVPGSTQFVKDGGIVSESSVLTYRIVVSNNGNTVVNHPIARDVLPANVTYVTNSLRIDGEVMAYAVQYAFFTQGAMLTNFTPGMTKIITFDVRVNDCPTLGDHELINTAYAKADNLAEINDFAKVVVRVVRPGLNF